MEQESSNLEKPGKKKKIILQIIAVILIFVILATPYLLVIDWKRFAPVVALVWMYSVIYFIFLKKRK